MMLELYKHSQGAQATTLSRLLEQGPGCGSVVCGLVLCEDVHLLSWQEERTKTVKSFLCSRSNIWLVEKSHRIKML